MAGRGPWLKNTVYNYARDLAEFVWTLVGWLWLALRTIARTVWTLYFWIIRAVGLLIVFVVVLQLTVTTPRDKAYRYAVPPPPDVEALAAEKEPTDRDDFAACALQRKHADVLGLSDVNNDELAAIRLNKVPRSAFTCMLQEHVIPAEQPERWPNGREMGPIRYHLAFLEFEQNGDPAEEGLDGNVRSKSQLAILEEHLKRQKQNYVIAFIHGWRHDASIGDGNVADLRVYAAHAASFLDYRCKTANQYCDATVTAIYIGWRGARIDERLLKDSLGEWLGGAVGTTLAAMTLFDRKPISERIGPTAVSALRKIDKLVKGRNAIRADSHGHDRMIVFGHSLGGNMLASSLKEEMISMVRRYRAKSPALTGPGSQVPEAKQVEAPFGNLIVLLNPASEAANWTAIQRAMRQRILFSSDAPDELPEVIEGHNFFLDHQPPIYIAVTSASSWPIGGVRQSDLFDPATKRGFDEKRAVFRERVDFDWATHDLFPAFKFDFIPVADTWERKAGYYRQQAEIRHRCEARASPTDCEGWLDYYFLDRFFRILATTARNIPFMNTNSEETRTIGHLDPMRPPYGHLHQQREMGSTFYGVTHELEVNQGAGHDTEYRNAVSPFRSECVVVDHWLWTARAREEPHGSLWDSGYTPTVGPPNQKPNLTPVRLRTAPALGHLESQFRHGFYFGGMSASVRANDPFWNVRAYDTAMAEHDGYVSYPLMCAIHQLVMDNVAAPPNPPH